MRFLFISLAYASSILSANALNLVQRRDGESSRVVQHDIQRRKVANPVQHDRDRLRRRQANTVTASLTNEETLYFMDVSIGSPPQSMKLHIDTGSSDLWVNVGDSSACRVEGDPCEVSGVYNANSSSTYQYLNSDFNITYVDGSGAYGDYAKDTVKFADVTLKNQQFGIGYQSSSFEGVVGIGYPINEVAVRYGYDPYPNIPESLVQQGAINSNVYSLWLNDLDASTGSILFGGVNTDKYSGELATVPIVKDVGNVYAEFLIALTQIGADGSPGTLWKKDPVGALLDSGSSLMYLPDDAAKAIFDEVGANYDESQGVAFIDCDAANSGKTIDFTFSSPTIQVPLDELVIVAAVENGQKTCIVGIGMSGDGTPVLGDTFIRSAYIVYDIENNEISIAQTNFNSTSDNVMEIGSNAKVPGATAVQDPVTSVAVASDGAINVGFPSASSHGAAQPTAAVGYNLALLGAAGAAMFAL